MKKEAITNAISDDLLLRFREAAAIEHRLIELERWLETDAPAFDSPAYWRRWTVATSRLSRLVSKTPALEAFHDQSHAYLLAVYNLSANVRGASALGFGEK